MADWQRKICLQPEWDKAGAGEITVQEMATVIAKRLSAVRDFPKHLSDINDERDEIIDDFEQLAKDDSADFDDFDEVMHRLYDWGDIQISGQFFDAKKVCWIDRFERVSA